MVSRLGRCPSEMVCARELTGSRFDRVYTWIDEKLIYVCRLSYRVGLSGRTDWEAALRHITRSVKVG
jgi:hypothetical protein